MTDENERPTYEPSEGSTDSEEIEEEVYTLLFQRCNEGHDGIVNIDHLVDYIGQQTAEHQEHEVRYNLDLLREMLHCSTKTNCVDEATYAHVIRRWVQEVRSRSVSATSLCEETPQEEDCVDGVVDHSIGPAEVSKESLEASGGASSHTSELDQQELISNLKAENRRLQDTNHNLHHQIEQSEEALGKLVGDNDDLKQRVKNLQHSLSRLQALEKENHQLNSAVNREQEKCLKLSHSVDRQDQELHQLTEEMSKMQSQLSAVHRDRASAEEEKQALKRQLHQKEELIEKHVCKQRELESLHMEHLAEIDALDKKVNELTNINESLRSEHSELQGRFVEHERHRSFPVSSTPFRPSLTFHDELLECSLNANDMSLQTSQPSSSDSMDNGTDQSLDEFSKVLAETRTQIKEKTELLDKGLTELISTDATPSGTSSRLEGRDESVVLYEQFESKVSELAKSKRQSDRKVKKLSSDVRKLRSENQKLKDQLRQRSKSDLQDVNVEDTEQQGDGTPISPVKQTERILGEPPHVPFQDNTVDATANLGVEHARESSVRLKLVEGEGQNSDVQPRSTVQAFCRLWILLLTLYHLLKAVLLIMVATVIVTLMVVLAAQLHSIYVSCSFSPFRVLFSMFGSGVQLNHHGPIPM